MLEIGSWVCFLLLNVGWWSLELGFRHRPSESKAKLQNCVGWNKCIQCQESFYLFPHAYATIGSLPRWVASKDCQSDERDRERVWCMLYIHMYIYIYVSYNARMISVLWKGLCVKKAPPHFASEGQLRSVFATAHPAVCVYVYIIVLALY